MSVFPRHASDEEMGSPADRLLRSVFHSMREGVVVQVQGGAIVRVNPAAEAILGLSADEMTGRTSADPRWRTEHEDGSPFLGETHPAMVALATGRPVRGVLMVVHKPDGTRTVIEISSEPIVEPGAAVPTHAVSTFLDVTEREMNAGRLRALAERVADLYNHAPCAYHSLGPDGTYLEINDTELEWLGATREDVIGLKTPTDFMAPECRRIFEEHFPLIREGRNQQEVELDFLRPGGGVRRVSVTASRVTDADGRFIMTRSVMYDISELFALRRALEQRTRDLESMLDNEVVAVARLSARRFVWVNGAAARMFGYAAEALVGQSTLMMFPDEQAFDRVGESFYRQVRETGAFREQTELLRKDGTVLWVDLYGSPLEGTTDFLAFLTDLTPVRAAQTRLMEARRLESVGRLAGGVAHEFNNKLQAVLGLSELALLDTGTDGRLAQDLRAIQSAARHAATVARQLMAYAGKQPASPQVLDVRDGIDKRLLLLRPLLSPDVALTVDASADVWAVTMDRGQFTEVLVNLVINASEAVDARGRIAIDARNVVVDEARAARCVDGRPGEFVELVVRDTGAGMTAEVLKRACEPFFTTKPFGNNSGLGLSTTYGIVTQNGGWLEMTSEVGRGTAVAVLLPRAAAREGDESG